MEPEEPGEGERLLMEGEADPPVIENPAPEGPGPRPVPPPESPEEIERQILETSFLTICLRACCRAHRCWRMLTFVTSGMLLAFSLGLIITQIFLVEPTTRLPDRAETAFGTYLPFITQQYPLRITGSPTEQRFATYLAQELQTQNPGLEMLENATSFLFPVPVTMGTITDSQLFVQEYPDWPQAPWTELYWGRDYTMHLGSAAPTLQVSTCRVYVVQSDAAFVARHTNPAAAAADAVIYMTQSWPVFLDYVSRSTNPQPFSEPQPPAFILKPTITLRNISAVCINSTIAVTVVESQGYNVAARLQSNGTNLKRTIVLAHHDSIASPEVVGSIAGVAALLGTAAALLDVTPMREVIFLSCTGANQNNHGLRYFLDLPVAQERAEWLVYDYVPLLGNTNDFWVSVNDSTADLRSGSLALLLEGLLSTEAQLNASTLPTAARLLHDLQLDYQYLRPGASFDSGMRAILHSVYDNGGSIVYPNPSTQFVRALARAAYVSAMNTEGSVSQSILTNAKYLVF